MADEEKQPYGNDIDQWGHALWRGLFPIVLSLPVNPSAEDKAKFRRFFEGLLLPCHVCYQHFQKYLKEHPLTDDGPLASPRALFLWLLALRNEIREGQLKPPEDWLDVASQYMPTETAIQTLGLNPIEVMELQAKEKQRTDAWKAAQHTEENRNPDAWFTSQSETIVFWTVVALLVVFVILFALAVSGVIPSTIPVPNPSLQVGQISGNFSQV